MKNSLTAQLCRLGYENYQSYLESAHWLKFRKSYYKSKRAKRCAMCNSRQICLHHITYARLGRENHSDVIPLCKAHHEAVHSWLNEQDKPVENTFEAIEALRKSRAPSNAFPVSRDVLTSSTKELVVRRELRDRMLGIYIPRLQVMLERKEIKEAQYNHVVRCKDIILAEKLLYGCDSSIVTGRSLRIKPIKLKKKKKKRCKAGKSINFKPPPEIIKKHNLMKNKAAADLKAYRSRVGKVNAKSNLGQDELREMHDEINRYNRIAKDKPTIVPGIGIDEWREKD